MSVIRIETSRPYDVQVAPALLAQLGQQVTACLPGARTAALISDDAVYALYGRQATERLQAAGLRVITQVFPHGEESKTLQTYAGIQEALCRARLTRSDVIVALGGGVVGDMAGFVAATYQRGVACVQVPTTLLAMVDSSVGGKTAVDLPGGKNQVGAFWQPALVLCDTDTLSTLPAQQYACGMAEVIKYAMLGSAPLFRALQQGMDPAEMIATCVQMKRDVVLQDEFDRGGRMVLNLGHTLGHAVEGCSSFTVLHGQGVAIGMAMMARAAAAQGLCPAEDAQALCALLQQYDLPIQTEYPAARLYDMALADKKRAGDTLHLVVPRGIGRCSIEKVPVEALHTWLRLGGAPCS